MEAALITEELYNVVGATEDPADDIFLACALESNADYIVSRDPHLRNISHFQGVQIIGVKTFIEEVNYKR